MYIYKSLLSQVEYLQILLHTFYKDPYNNIQSQKYTHICL